MIRIASIILTVAVLLPYFGAALLTTDSLIAGWTRNTNKNKQYSVYTDVTKIAYTSTSVYIKAQGMPNYSIGPTWPNNPNSASGQDYTFEIPVTPTPRSSPMDISLTLGPIGIWINGMVIYNPWDGVSYNSQGVWHRNALVFEGSSFDSCYGHPDVSGVYHNHVNPKCMYTASSTAHSPIVGFAFDGYPIYGPYGYTNPASATSAIKLMVPSYAIRTSYTNRQTLANGTTLGSTYYGPTFSATYTSSGTTGTYTAGAFLEDYVYTVGSGDLDACNGRTTVTPDYPGGTYAYFVTTDSSGVPVYPFGLGLCFYGTPTLGNGRKTIPSSATVVFDNASSQIEMHKTFSILSLVAAFLVSKLLF